MLIFDWLHQLIRPVSIKLNFPIFYFDSPQIASYKPSGSHIRNIVLEVNLPDAFEMPLFDFSCVPEARIHATIYLGVELKMHIPVSTDSLTVRYYFNLLILYNFFTGGMAAFKS